MSFIFICFYQHKASSFYTTLIFIYVKKIHTVLKSTSCMPMILLIVHFLLINVGTIRTAWVGSSCWCTITTVPFANLEYEMFRIHGKFHKDFCKYMYLVIISLVTIIIFVPVWFATVTSIKVTSKTHWMCCTQNHYELV